MKVMSLKRSLRLNRSKIIIAGILVSLLLSCEKPKDYFGRQNIPPVVSLSVGGGMSNVINDRFKLSTQVEYTFFIHYEDDQELFESEEIQTSGSGTLTRNDTIYHYVPDTTGEHVINFYFYDPYQEKSNQNTLNLDVFWNDAPVADFSYTLDNTILNVDASASFDQDSDQGGYITKYSFSLDNNEYQLNSSIFTQSIDEGVIHFIKVKVQDNDGAWSDPVTQIIQP